MGLLRWWKRSMTPAGFEEQVAEAQRALGFTYDNPGTLPELDPPPALLSFGEQPSVGYVLSGRRGHARAHLFSFGCLVERAHIKDQTILDPSSQSGLELLLYLDPGRPGQVPVHRSGALVDLPEARPGRVKVVAAELYSREPYPHQRHQVSGDDILAVDDCDQGRLALFLEARRGHSFEVAAGYALCLAPVVGPARIESVLQTLEQFVWLLPPPA
jgi:hypothetical protein